MAFQLYIQHFVEQSEINIKNIVLTKNYRGRFANFADQILETVTKVSETEDKKMDKLLERLLKTEAKIETTLYSETMEMDLSAGTVTAGKRIQLDDTISFGSGGTINNNL